MSVPVHMEGSPAVAKVLLYRLGSLGDMAIAVPALRLVERAYPSAERRLLTNFPVAAKAPAAKAVFGDSGLVHSYERYVVGTRNPLELLRLAWRIRRFSPDVLVYLVAARGVAVAERDRRFFRWLCGVRHLIGIPVTQEMQDNLTQPDGTLEPEAARLSRNIGVLGNTALADAESWDLRLTDEEERRADVVLQPVADRKLIAVCVGTKVQAKDWGSDNWRTLLTALGQRYPDHSLVLMGAPEEAAVSEFVADGWRESPLAGPVLNTCGLLAPRESAAALRRCVLFLGHDSGPMHLAAAVRTPCVAIFAARNIPRVWFPFGTMHHVLYHRVDCWGCELEVCVEQKKKCLMSITVEEVLQAVDSALQTTGSASR